MSDNSHAMTNRGLLQMREALANAAEGFQSVRGRYAIQENLRAVEQALEGYYSMLRSLGAEHDVDVQSKEALEGAPESFHEDLDELLSAEVNEPDLCTIEADVLQAEDARGSDISIETLSRLDFMIST